MRIALVHDYLNEAGGAERVLRVLSDMYPEAPIYTAFAKNGTAKAMFKKRQIVESKWAWLLKMGRLYSYLRFLLPWVWKSMDLRKYDLVITSCSGYLARGFRVREGARVIAYCHTPPRWLYGYDTPTGSQNKWWGKAFMWVVGPFVRYFDYQSSQRVDTWIANSHEVARRIEKFYRKPAQVIYPPVELIIKPLNHYTIKKNEYYLIVSRIVGGKGILEAALTCKKLGIKLKIAGEVVDHGLGTKLMEVAECLGRVAETQLPALYSGARGFVALAKDEDFGMTLVEAMSQGTPVLAYKGGGYKETVRAGETGVFIDGVDVKSVAEGIKQMERTKWKREEIIKWAGKFGRARFEKEITEVVHA
ncbi:MAG: Glycosyl transferase group 1 [Microgenomates group bacterium GW2011_GWA2_46_7]|nr:MAG: Glycosyl transferase group 1 [Microgenomates group bacterium GW2011_GWA2_46_7]